MNNFISINGILTAPEKAVLPVDNLELTYGFGVYEHIRFRNKALYFADEHIERLFHSAQIIGLAHHFSKTEIKTWMIDLIKKNETESANIKILLIGGVDPMLYIMELAPKFPEKKWYKDGVRAITAEFERFLPQAKTLNMLASYILYKKATETKAFDTILCDRYGNILEGTRSNIFFVKEKTLHTASVETVLHGVTRTGVIACADKLGYEVIEKHIPLMDLALYDGAFFTNTSGKIMPIREINAHVFPHIPITTRELMKSFDQYLETRAEFI